MNLVILKESPRYITLVIDCDGLQCGLGKYNGRTYTCPHNNFSSKYPDIAKEWNYELNNDSPVNYLPKSNKKKWWKCSKSPCQCHIWETSIYNRTNGSGCPYCNKGKPCEHNNFATNYPNIAKEWDYNLNKDVPENYSIGSNIMKSWICEKNPCGCHKWIASINNRTSGTGCPFCNRNYLCSHNNLAIKYPNIAKEWDYERNNTTPDKILPGSGDMIWWKCIKDPCGCHKWQAPVYSRLNSGCPYCGHNAVCSHNNLSFLYPNIAKEWNYKLNNDSPENYLPGSNTIKWWTCAENPCGCHIWQSRICDRRIYGCPYCNRNKLCPHNNLSISHPNIAKQWHHFNNDLPENYLYGSHTIKWWVCDHNKNHIWEATIKNRTLGKTGCPVCKESHGEALCAKILDELKLNYNREWGNVPNLNDRYFDFYIHEIKTLIEYDGIQHFEEIAFFSKRKEDFNMRREIDIIKSKIALKNNYNLIRIDYKMSESEVRNFLIESINSKEKLCLSNPKLYQWLICEL